MRRVHLAAMEESRRYGPTLVLMSKEPRAGRVKTRLARDVGTIAATRFIRSNFDLTLRRIASDLRWRTILAVAPDTAIASRMFPASIARTSQGRGDLGEKLRRVFAHGPAGPMIVIGGDIPGIRTSDIARAFKALSGADAVFGPSADGGYWLVGLSRRARRLPVFQNVRWSSAFALADTLNNLNGYDVRTTTCKHDVDSGADLAGLSKLCGRFIMTESP